MRRLALCSVYTLLCFLHAVVAAAQIDGVDARDIDIQVGPVGVKIDDDTGAVVVNVNGKDVPLMNNFMHGWGDRHGQEQPGPPGPSQGNTPGTPGSSSDGGSGGVPANSLGADGVFTEWVRGQASTETDRVSIVTVWQTVAPSCTSCMTAQPATGAPPPPPPPPPSVPASESSSQPSTSQNVEPQAPSPTSPTLPTGSNLPPSSSLPTGSNLPPQQTYTPNSGGDDQNNAIDCHNHYRTSNLGPAYQAMLWDADLSAQAQAYAQHLANTPSLGLTHSTSDQRGGAGENLWSSSAPSKQPFEDAALAWTQGEQAAFNTNYSPSVGIPCMCNGIPASAEAYLHYTQVVWNSALQFGMGVATSPTGYQVVVARYAKAGNFMGQDIFGNAKQQCCF